MSTEPDPKLTPPPAPANDPLPYVVWTCECNSQLYNLTSDGPYCFGCGKRATDWIEGV